MCVECGCGDVEIVSVEAHDRLLAKNDAVARHNREHFAEHGVLALNIMGSPGSGKTALLEATARAATGWRLAGVSGDLATDRDAVRLTQSGIDARSITTGTACHLDAKMIHEALHEFPHLPEIFFVENVGNLVCPAIYDLGQAANVVLLSVTEGEDKPLKYPVMFQHADLVLITKMDLLRALPEVSVRAMRSAIASVNPVPPVLEVSARTGEGLDAWIDWLRLRRANAVREEAVS
ncbi:MAG TPA: hydrogenase nickel incorporation protein HypB [bacterium]|nr:hydrogenase nickel incorporation protein HypB [bacterium]